MMIGGDGTSFGKVHGKEDTVFITERGGTGLF
jgi:hypothetical protein